MKVERYQPQLLNSNVGKMRDLDTSMSVVLHIDKERAKVEELPSTLIGIETLLNDCFQPP